MTDCFIEGQNMGHNCAHPSALGSNMEWNVVIKGRWIRTPGIKHDDKPIMACIWFAATIPIFYHSIT